MASVATGQPGKISYGGDWGSRHGGLTLKGKRAAEQSIAMRRIISSRWRERPLRNLDQPLRCDAMKL